MTRWGRRHVRRLRIAFINPTSEIGGAERSLLLLLDGLDRDRYAPVVFCPGRGRLGAALDAIGVPTTVAALGRSARLSRFGGRAGMGDHLSAAFGVGAAVTHLIPPLREVRPDLIHTNGLKAHLVGGLCGRLLRRPVIWHVRDLVAEGRALSLFRAASDWLPRRIIAISQPVAAQFAGRRAAARTRTVHNAVDLARFRPSRPAAAVRAELGIAPHIVLLAMVAHFAPWKGHHLFLEIVARLVREGLPVAGLVVGGPIYQSWDSQGYEAEVRAACRERGLDKKVTFTGFQECVADFIDAADILVHPPTRPEPFGRVIIEAMALGKPVVAPAAGGILEIVEPGRTGLLVPPGDRDAFVTAVRSLLDDTPRRIAIGERGKEQVAQSFTPAAHVRQVERVYLEILPIADADQADVCLRSTA
jgi:glycosyltransferase involved in cell wall biosynthesis